MVVRPTVHYQGLPGDESRIGPRERRQPPPRSTGSISRARTRPRSEGSFTPARLPFGASCLPDVQEASTVEDDRVHWKKRQKQIARLKARHGADRSLIREFPDLKVEQRTAPCSNGMRGSTARRPRPAGMRQFPVGHIPEHGVELIPLTTDMKAMWRKKTFTVDWAC